MQNKTDGIQENAHEKVQVRQVTDRQIITPVSRLFYA